MQSPPPLPAVEASAGPVAAICQDTLTVSGHVEPAQHRIDGGAVFDYPLVVCDPVAVGPAVVVRDVEDGIGPALADVRHGHLTASAQIDRTTPRARSISIHVPREPQPAQLLARIEHERGVRISGEVGRHRRTVDRAADATASRLVLPVGHTEAAGLARRATVR